MENINKNDNYNSKEIEIWKKKLLDLGKRNNLINFKDNKTSTLEILSPDFFTSFLKITSNSSIQIFDDKLKDSNDILSSETNNLSKAEYLEKYLKKVTQSQLLVYNQYQKSKTILKSLMKKASDSITERGVNILYAAFGFVVWKELNIEYKAPLILVPITITNEAVNKPYYIHHFDDDIVLNQTLSYLLENQYGIKIKEYEDENLLDYISNIENQLAPLNWKIEKEARISIFSFNKLNMYLDLENNKKRIISNQNIKALTNAEISGDIFINSEDLDAMNKKRDLFINQHNVVDADFSQSEAIEYAMMGKSFVLQGPPGTGKSQTITNIIAELIYAGKKVLFVSEKMAALEVVYNNLKKAKLSDFCLELHSYKANKKDFIEELHKTLNTPKTIVSEVANDNLAKLNEALKKLNSYDEKLYKIYQPINMSLYQLIGFANHYFGTKEVPYVINNINELNKDDLNNYSNYLDKYATFEKSIGYNYKNNLLYGLNLNDSSYAFKIEFEKNLKNIKKDYELLIEELKDIKSYFNIDLSTSNEINLFIDFVNFCIDNEFKDNKLYDNRLLDQLISSIDELDELEKYINDNTSNLLKKYDNEILEEDSKKLYNDFAKYGNSFIKRIFNHKYKNAKKSLKELTLNNKNVKYKKAIEDLYILTIREDKLNRYNELSNSFKNENIIQFKYLNTDWKKLKSLLINLKSKLFDNILLSNENFSQSTLQGANKLLISKLELNYFKLIKDEALIEKYIDKEILNLPNLLLIDNKNRYEGFINSLDNIDSWIEFSRLYNDLKNNNLLEFIDKVIELNYPLKKISDYYKLCFYRQLIDYIFKNDQDLYNYSRYEHEADIKTFNKNDKIELSISKAKINAKLSKMRPDPLLQMAGSPASIIMREHEKKRKIKPIRALMREIPDFIQELKPCFLMSPLSVSTYLSDEMNFDVTIFDEASQVFPEDAIVAIYRSKQLIVVGDSKQMPPTKFFMAEDTDDEYDEDDLDIDSYESILDLCSTSFPTKSLLCHYRSKDESLISFSNKNFYNYNLLTYPSIHDNQKDLGVDFEYVNGIMDNRSKINVVEAERVVDLVFEHYKKYPNRSLGVVAFNIKQQDAILKLLDKRRAKDPSLEEYFKPDLEEPFFVKNLETVQGDERDTIIFSITYAKNDKGSFALRFGPLNLAGGERRLNVAITRAKLNVKVVSSIKATDIDISRVANDGPKLLHDYLDYAEHGTKTLTSAIAVSQNEEFDSPFEEDVYKFLKANGFDVTTQVGCSKYRIDLGLKKPNTSDYVLAIECDGATYHTSKSARDRDRIRQSVLESMNWKFYRIWSTDWYKNNKVEKKALLEACKDAINSNEEKINKPKENVDISNLVKTQETKGSVQMFDSYNPYNKNEIFKDPTKAAIEYVKAEGPVAVNYLLKQISYIWGSTKVTRQVKNAFKASFKKNPECSLEDGFLYGLDQKNYAMRANLGQYLKDINYISDYEIRNGMYEAIKMNVSCKKEDLFNFIRTQLGFNRAGDKISIKLEDAFITLIPYINIDKDGDITINKNKPLKIIRRNK